MSEEKTLAEIQIGKNKITENFIRTLKEHFKKHKNVKISVLKSARLEGKKGKEQVRNYAEEIIKSLGGNHSYRILGFTIAIKKLKR